jgi:hypothetical protein
VSRRRARSAWAAGPDEESGRVPPEVLERAKAAFGRRGPDAVAEIVSDVAEQAHGRQRHLRFAHELVRVDLWVGRDEDHVDLRGQAEPPPVRVELELEVSPLTVAEDTPDGTFSFSGVPNGVMRLRVVPGEGAPIATAWFLA